jgi:hypothetical protein
VLSNPKGLIEFIIVLEFLDPSTSKKNESFENKNEEIVSIILYLFRRRKKEKILR